MSGTSKPSLKGPLAKVSRARVHLDCLQEEIRTFNKSNPYAVDDKFDPDSRKYEAWFKAPSKELDELALGVRLGDFVHNLRSALDHLVGQLVLLSGGKRIAGSSQFPIATKGTDYWCVGKDGKSTRDRLLTGVSEKFRTPIDQVQPYRAGRDAKRTHLALLNWLSNIDKHRFIHPAWALIAGVRQEHFTVTTDAEWTILDVDVETGELKDGAKILTVTIRTSDPNAEVEVKGNLPIEIGFGERRGGRGGIRFSDLESLGTRVQQIILSYANVLPTN